MLSGEECFAGGFRRVREVFAVLIADGVENGGFGGCSGGSEDAIIVVSTRGLNGLSAFSEGINVSAESD